MIRVTVIDDEENIHEILRFASKYPGSGFQVVSAYQKAPDVSRLRGDLPDVIFLDIVGCNGIEKAREIADQLPECKVIFFTAYDHPTMVTAAHDAGGSGYLVKPTPIQELIEAIHKVSKEERLPFPLQARSKPDHEGIWERLNLLTPREIEIVHWRSRGFTNLHIGTIMGLSEQRIKNIVSRIFHKTGTSRMEETIAFLYREGILKYNVPPY